MSQVSVAYVLTNPCVWQKLPRIKWKSVNTKSNKVKHAWLISISDEILILIFLQIFVEFGVSPAFSGFVSPSSELSLNLNWCKVALWLSKNIWRLAQDPQVRISVIWSVLVSINDNRIRVIVDPDFQFCAALESRSMFRTLRYDLQYCDIWNLWHTNNCYLRSSSKRPKLK